MARKPKQTIFPEEMPKGFNAEGAALCAEYHIDERLVDNQTRVKRTFSHCEVETGMVIHYTEHGLRHIFVRMKPDFDYPYAGETFFCCIDKKMEKWEMCEQMHFKYGITYGELSDIFDKSVNTIKGYIKNLYSARYIDSMMIKDKKRNGGIVNKQYYITLKNDLTGLNKKDDDESENNNKTE